MSEELIAEQLDLIKQNLDAFIFSLKSAMAAGGTLDTDAIDELIVCNETVNNSIIQLRNLL